MIGLYRLCTDMDTIVWLIVFLQLPLDARCIQRCYTTSCNSSSVCIEACQSNDRNCHLHLRPNHFSQYEVAGAGCARNSLLNISTFGTPCQIVRFPRRLPESYCFCEGDLCNERSGFSDSVRPFLRIPPLLPTVAVPEPQKGQQVCEWCHCHLSTVCSCSYELCPIRPMTTQSYCRARYKVDPSNNRIKLVSKGCLTQHVNQSSHDLQCASHAACHIDNPLHAVANEVFECCCSGRLCNQNVTFTHPTRHSRYGDDECHQHCGKLDCTIVNNEPHCSCKTGFRLAPNGRNCEDIDECKTNFGGCSHFCENTNGSFQCTCLSSYYLSRDGRTCKKKHGLVCAWENYNTSNSALPSEQYCFDSVSEELQGRQTCTAGFEYRESGWVVKWRHCSSGGLPCVNTSVCVLQQVQGQKNHYFCCCKTNFCNANEGIVFPLSVHTSVHTSVHASTVFPYPSAPSFPSENTFQLSTYTLLLLGSTAGVVVFLISVGVFTICVVTLYNRRTNLKNHTLECPPSTATGGALEDIGIERIRELSASPQLVPHSMKTSSF